MSLSDFEGDAGHPLAAHPALPVGVKDNRLGSARKDVQVECVRWRALRGGMTQFFANFLARDPQAQYRDTAFLNRQTSCFLSG